jgi:hypothetical protein
MHHIIEANFDDLLWSKRPWRGAQADAESKLYDAMLAFCEGALQRAGAGLGGNPHGWGWGDGRQLRRDRLGSTRSTNSSRRSGPRWSYGRPRRRGSSGLPGMANRGQPFAHRNAWRKGGIRPAPRCCRMIARTYECLRVYPRVRWLRHDRQTAIEINVDTFTDRDSYFVRTEVEVRSVNIYGPFPDPQTGQKLKADQLANRAKVSEALKERIQQVMSTCSVPLAAEARLARWPSRP